MDLSVSLVGLFIIKYKRDTNLALTSVAFVSVYLVSASAYLAGGLQSNDILWYLVLSSGAFLFIEVKSGFIISFLSFLGITFFYLNDVFNFIKIPVDPVSMTPAYRYFNFALILAILSAMTYILVRGNNKLQIALQQAKEQKVKEEIARDFHDEIGNKLASLRHLAELIHLNKTNTEKEEIISKIDAKAKDVYDNFRDFIWTLDVKSDEVAELFMYLRDFSEDHFKFSTVNIFINSVPDQLPPILLPSAYSKEIFPLFKEAITNIQKHSEAKNAWLDFILTPTALTIKLRDDGKGMDESLFRGNGLTNMKHRAKKTGGTLDILSSSKGTEIIYSLSLPFPGSKTKD